MSEEYRRIGTLAEIPRARSAGTSFLGLRLAVVQLDRRGVRRGDECPADGSALSDGEVDDYEWSLVCPHDASAFDVRTGEPVRGVAVDPVPVFRVRIEEGWSRWRSPARARNEPMRRNA
jgi:3-phenylpropionate/trans-cinnamate dioxygenase ferredoxin subunit